MSDGEAREPGREAREPGAEVGLGRVVENPGRMGREEPRTDEGPLVEEASEDSFPASDPPVFMSEPATSGGPERTELPDPRDVP